MTLTPSERSTSWNDPEYLVSRPRIRVLAAFMLATGTMGDRFVRKRVMLFGVVVFTSGSILGALAPNIPTLVAWVTEVTWSIFSRWK